MIEILFPLRSQFSSLSADSTFPSTALSLPPLDASAESSEPSEPYYANQTVSQRSAGTPAKAFSSIGPSPTAPVPAPSSIPVAATGLAGSYSGGSGGGSKAAQLLRAATHLTNATNATSPAAPSPSPVPASTPTAGSTHPLLPPPDPVLCQTPSPTERQNGYLVSPGIEVGTATSKFVYTQPLANGDHPTANEVRVL